MKPTIIPVRTFVFVAAALFISAGFAHAHGFDWENLQSDVHGVGELTDAHVVNPWGLAHSDWGTIFVVDNGSGVATQYFEDGTPAPSFGIHSSSRFRGAQLTLKAQTQPVSSGTTHPSFTSATA